MQDERDGIDGSAARGGTGAAPHVPNAIARLTRRRTPHGIQLRMHMHRDAVY